MSREAVVAAAFLELADTLAPAFEPAELLGRLARLTTDLLDVDAAAVALTGEGGEPWLTTVAGPVQAREALLAGVEAGPWSDCLRGGRSVVSADLVADRHRWLRFVAKATAAGYGAAATVPLRRHDDVLGAVLVLRPEPGTLSDSDEALARVLADSAALGLQQYMARRRTESEVEQLQGALLTRVVIEQAKGALALYGRIGVDDAFAALRRHARRHGRPLSEVAHEVVDGRIRPGDVVDAAR